MLRRVAPKPKDQSNFVDAFFASDPVSRFGQIHHFLTIELERKEIIRNLGQIGQGMKSRWVGSKEQRLKRLRNH
jgi:hypothetical protein